MWHKLSREPLIHFLGGALLVFAIFWVTGSDRNPADYTISIDETDIERLKAGWVQNFRRAPTQAELDSLIDQEIDEEIYYREALRLGLDKDDPVVRRRLFTKMRFIESEEFEDTDPDDRLLQRWMDEHPESYMLPTRYDFEQVYLGPIAKSEAERQVDELNKGIDPATVARPLSIAGTFARVDATEVGRLFGDRFAEQLDDLPMGVWSGPVASGFGSHAVMISARTFAGQAKLEAVRQRVTNDWLAERAAEQKEKALNRYRTQYDIAVAGRS